MDKKNTPFTFDNVTTPEKLLIQLCFHFSVLIEYQLNALQANVREFVFAMSDAIQEMDNLVVAEGKSAQELFENLFNQSKESSAEASKLNTRANKRAEEIFMEAVAKLHPGQTPTATFNSAPSSDTATILNEKDSSNSEAASIEATDKIWSDIAKKFESFCRMEERLRPQVYTMIQSLNFEDIQTQRLEHALTAQKKLNEGIVNFLRKGLQNCALEEVKEFANKLVAETRASYSMAEERAVFDQVFLKPEDKKS